MIDEVLTPAFVRERMRELGQGALPQGATLPSRRPLDGRRERRWRAAPFIPSDRVQSQVQSLLEERIAESPSLTTDSRREASPCGAAPPPPDASPRAAAETLTGHFGPNDIGWLQTKIAEIQREGWAPFSDKPVEFPLDPQARVLLVSDWAPAWRAPRRSATRCV
jgi:hypothetical protein